MSCKLEELANYSRLKELANYSRREELAIPCNSLETSTSQKHHVINNETFGSKIGLHFRFKAPLIIQTNYRSCGLLFGDFRHILTENIQIECLFRKISN